MLSKAAEKLLALKLVCCRDRSPISLGDALWREGMDVEMASGDVLDPVPQPLSFSFRLVLNSMLIKAGNQSSRKRESVLVFLLFDLGEFGDVYVS